MVRDVQKRNFNKIFQLEQRPEEGHKDATHTCFPSFLSKQQSNI